MFMELLDKIKLKETDTLYVLWDVPDWGLHPIKTLRKLMEMPNTMLIWVRADYYVRYFEDTYVIMGHTLTQTIEDNPHPGYIYKFT